MSAHAHRALVVSRAHVVDRDDLRAVVIEVDATGDPQALAVLQAALHEQPGGQRLIHGYRVVASGLGAWVGDRNVRVVVWPAYVDEAGEISETDPDDPDADVLVVDIDPAVFRDELAALAELGRLVIAGPEAGPVPLVLDVDRDLVAEVIAQVASSGS